MFGIIGGIIFLAAYGIPALVFFSLDYSNTWIILPINDEKSRHAVDIVGIILGALSCLAALYFYLDRH